MNLGSRNIIQVFWINTSFCVETRDSNEPVGRPPSSSLHFNRDLRICANFVWIYVGRVFRQPIAPTYARKHEHGCHEIYHAMKLAFAFEFWNQHLGFTPESSASSEPRLRRERNLCSKGASEASRGAKIFASVSKIDIAP